jgi:hypothetical protein
MKIPHAILPFLVVGFLTVSTLAITLLSRFMDLKDSLLTAATFMGPITSTFIAVYYTHAEDKDRLKTDRKLEVFRNLIKTRAFPLHPDFVMSLNLVQVDFADDDKVMSCWKGYIDHLYKSVPSDGNDAQRFNDEKSLLFGKLIVSIAASLGIPLSSEEVKHFGYMPTGWAINENEQQQLRKLMIGVCQGLNPIAIKPAPQNAVQLSGSVFPPPP